MREHNEDSFLSEFPVFIVADGMGGHEAGDVASAAVVDAFRELGTRDNLEVLEVLTAAQSTHERVSEATNSASAGSTLTGMVAIVENTKRFWLVLNLGDSRVYRLKNGVLEQLTKDHSLLQEKLDSGEISPDEALHFTSRNVITKAVGDGGSIVDHFKVPMVAGERFLICSDGLSSEVDDETIRTGLSKHAETSEAARFLIERALDAGGRDNVTVVVVDVQGTGGDYTIEVNTVPSARRPAGQQSV